MIELATVLQQKCPNCGGAVEFDADSQRLKCPYCDTEFDISEETENVANLVEKSDWSSTGAEWSQGETDGMSVYICNSCGGEIIADESTGASTCPYCDSPVVMKGQFSGALRPDLVIPFKFDKKAAKDALKKHFKGKKFVPKGFLSDNKIDEIKGVYVPFWLFTCDTYFEGVYTGKKIRRWSDSRYNYTEISEYKFYRNGNISFDNVPVDASVKMDDALMESLEPYDLSQAVDFNTAYLSGYIADKFDLSADDSVNRVNERIKNTAESEFEKTIVDYTGVSPETSAMNIADGFYKYALYPVWLLNVTWEGKVYPFAMNGQTGLFVGDIPTNKKLAWLVGLLGGAVAGLASYFIAFLAGLF